jgi:hypothetical protein
MLTFLKKFLSLKPQVVPEPSAPYKVEAPVPASAETVKAPVTCGCGRSSTGECVGLHTLTADQWAISDKNPNRVVADQKPVKAKTAAKKAEAKAPAKPRTPRKRPIESMLTSRM